MSSAMTIKAYIFGKARKAPRGAISRVAEYIGTNHNKAARLVHGIDDPTPEVEAKFRWIVEKGLSLLPKKTGPAPGKKAKRKTFSRS